MNYLVENSGIILIITPRTFEQGLEIAKQRKKEIESGKIFILDQTINGLDLIWVSFSN